MTADTDTAPRLLPPERLAVATDPDDLLEHIDALTAELARVTAERDKARQESNAQEAARRSDLQLAVTLSRNVSAEREAKDKAEDSRADWQEAWESQQVHMEEAQVALADVRAELARVRASIRTRCVRVGGIATGNHPPLWECAFCGRAWDEGQPENHAPGCDAAPTTEGETT